MSPPNGDERGKKAANYLIARLNRLKDDWPSERRLRRLQSREVEALLNHISEAKREGPRVIAGSIAICAFLILAIHNTGEFQLWLPLSVCLFFTLAVVTDPAALQRIPTYALTQTNDMRVLPTLIQATRHKWGRHPQVRAAILRLLEQVTEEHVGLLNNAMQQRLWTIGLTWQTLSDNYDHEVALKVLRALATVGNHTTLARVRRFAGRSEHFINERYVIAEARQLVPVMETRFQRQQVPETLLRAADTPTNQPETLLRAAHATTPEPRGQLLRASTSEHPNTETNL